MGNLCSNRSLYYHYTTSTAAMHSNSAGADTGSVDDAIGHTLRPSTLHSVLQELSLREPTGPVSIPSLFDLCIHTLCFSLIDDESMAELSKRRRSTLRLDEFHAMIMRQILEHAKMENLPSAGFSPRSSVTPRHRALSLTSKESPELSPQPTPVLGPMMSGLSLGPSPSPLHAPSLTSPSASRYYQASSRSMARPDTGQAMPKSSLASPSSFNLQSPRQDSSILHQLRASDSPSNSSMTQPIPIVPSLPSSPQTLRGHSQSHSYEDEEFSPLHTSSSFTGTGAGDSRPGRSVSEVLTMGLSRRRRSWFAGGSRGREASHPPLPPSYSMPSSYMIMGSGALSPRNTRLQTLPDSIIQLIFDRLVQQRLLTERSLHLFARSDLSRIDLAAYPDVDDDWLLVLLSVARQFEVVNSTDNNGVGRVGEKEELSTPSSGSQSRPIAINGRQIGESEEKKDSHPKYSLSSSYSSTSHSYLSTSLTNSPAPLNLSPSIKPLPSHSLMNGHSPFSSLTAPNPLSLPSLTYLDVSKCDAITDRSLYSLIHCPRLTSLNLDGCTQCSEDLLMLVLPHIRSLRRLNVNHCRSVGDRALETLSHYNVKLQVLSADSTSITDSGLAAIANLTELRSLSLAYNGDRVTGSGLTWLPHCPYLRSLNLCGTHCYDIALYSNCLRLKRLNISGTKIKKSLLNVGKLKGSQWPKLTNLVMQRCDCKELPMNLLHYHMLELDCSFNKELRQANVLQQFQSLLALQPPSTEQPAEESLIAEDEDYEDGESVSGTAPSSQQSSASSARRPLVDVTQSAPLLPLATTNQPQPPPLSLPSTQTVSAPPLRVLKVESCAVGNAFVALLPSFPHLTELNLSDTDIDQDGLAPLSSLTSLTSLHLTGCKLNNACLAALTPLTQLRSLYLDCAMIGDAGLTHLSSLTSLTHLDLFESSISAEGVNHLLPMKSLRSLELANTRINNTSLTVIAKLSKLQSLNVCQNRNITDGGLVALAKLARLTHVNLSNTTITTRGLQSLLAQCSSIEAVSVFGCKIKIGELHARGLTDNVQIGCDEGILQVEEQH